jgi:anhydro-N-acetylmuramic acid kinase
MITKFLSIGLMSGTSMDGIDAALIESDGLNHIKELGHSSLSYEALFKIALKAAEYSVKKAQGDLKQAETNFPQTLNDYLTLELKQTNTKKTAEDLHRMLQGDVSLKNIITHSTHLHAKIVKKLLAEMNISAEKIRVVGYHGQTLFHNPKHATSIIVGDGQMLANALGITVINDFRSNDMAHGGQGAPFAPLYHLALCVRDQFIPAAVINCGGISNISLISAEDSKSLIAFDMGPGNGLIDRLVRQRTNGQEDMDRDGHYGQQGRVDETVLTALFKKALLNDSQNYFSLKPPKALDIGDLHLIPELDHLSLEDACRTLEAFTAESILRSLDFVKTTLPKRWILAGGGWNNPVILEELRQRLTQRLGADLKIQNADEVGWNSQALEAQIFAYLAIRSLKNLPLSLPGTTGVPEPLSGGCIYQPNHENS